MVKAYSYFLKGKEEWILGKSEKYFKNIQGDISECKSLSDVEETLYNNFGQEKSLKPTINKIMSCMQDIWESNFLDISNRIPSNWMFNFDNEQFFDSPYMGLAKMGIVPIIVTSNLKNQHYYPQYKRLIYDKIFNLQLESKKRKRTWLFVDEIGNIYKRGQTKTVAADSLTRCVTEGRQPQLGVIYTIQNYSKLDEEIRNNTSYLFSLVYSSQEEINAIAADFDLPKNLKDTLKRLKPKEMMAMSNDKKFVIYTPDGNRYEQSGAFKGIGVPALSEHMRPSAIKYLFGITDEDETAEEEEENE